MTAGLSMFALSWLALAGVTQPADAAPAQPGATSPEAILARAIQAHGGPANVVKLRALTWKGKGRLYGLASGTPYEISGARQLGRQGVAIAESEINGQRHRLVRVINGEKGWVQLNERVEELAPALLAEEKERLHENWVATLVPLLDGGADLGDAGSTVIDERPATGVRIRTTGHRDVILYFDRETALLRKKATRISDPVRSSKEVLQETYYGEYQRVGGVLVAFKVQVFWDGKLYLDTQLTEVKPQGKLPDEVFFRPQPNEPDIRDVQR